MARTTCSNVEEKLALPMSVDAARAYAEYVGLGDERSHEALAARLAERTKDAPSVDQIKKWSSKYCWSQRIARPYVAEADASITTNARDGMQILRNCLSELLRRTAPERIAQLETRELVQIIDRVKPADSQPVDQTRKRFRIVEFAKDGA